MTSLTIVYIIKLIWKIHLSPSVRFGFYFNCVVIEPPHSRESVPGRDACNTLARGCICHNSYLAKLSHHLTKVPCSTYVSGRRGWSLARVWTSQFSLVSTANRSANASEVGQHWAISKGTLLYWSHHRSLFTSKLQTLTLVQILYYSISAWVIWVKSYKQALLVAKR